MPDLLGYEIANGNHRLPVLQHLQIDPVVCFSLGAVPVEEAIRLAVETNETYFPIDPLKLGARLKDLLHPSQATPHTLAAVLPLNADEISRYVALLDVDWEQLTPRPAPTTDPQPKDRPALEVTLTPGQFQQWMEFKLTLAQTEGIEDDATAVERLATTGLDLLEKK